MHAGRVSVSALWEPRDARIVANMIKTAATDGENAKEVEVVRESGIVVAKDMP
jgi:hypothetical protein